MSKKPHEILYLSYDGMTDPLGQSQVLPYLVGLTKLGYHFRLVSFEKPERFEQFKATISALCKANNIDWHPLKYTKKPPLLSTWWDVRKLNQKVKELHAEKAIDLIHCRSYISPIVALRMKKKHQIPFVFDMRGFWADERVDGKIWTLSNPIFKLVYDFFKRKEIEFLNEASQTVTLTHRAKIEILSWKKKLNKTPEIQVIPCCADLTSFDLAQVDSTKKADLQKSLSIDSTHAVLGYVGSIGTWYMLDEMLDFYKVQLTKNAKLLFLFVTGEKPETIYDKCAEKGIDLQHIRIVSCPYKEVPLYISLFDFSIFFIKSSYSKMASSPTKQGELMALGIPVICNVGVGDTDAIVSKYDAGILVENFTSECYEAIELDTSLFNKAHIRAGAQDYFALSEGVNSYHSVYQRVYA